MNHPFSTAGKWRITCVGHASVDHVFHVAAFPDRPTKTPAHAQRSVGGGMAANAALALARLGAQVSFVGAVGDDDAGALVRRHLAAEGIGLDQLQVVAGAQTSCSAIVVDDAGERQIFNHRGDALARAAVPAGTVFAGCDAVLVDPRWPQAAAAALRWARSNACLSMVDADVAPADDLERLVPLADWAVFSEPGLACWRPGVPLHDALRAAIAQGARHAAVTLGERGVCFLDGDTLCSVAPVPVQAVDTTGAGDVFHAALLLALARGDAVRDAMAWACAAAALKCSRAGGVTGAPRAEELAAFLQARAAPPPPAAPMA